ncbi:PTS system mannose/fructose/N-acetylgalactosamine-transporter subunit IIB [Clostridium baratii]|uniref:PTS system mannose/fructose/N-acetylgalactosamine-transporter subunit IIB n=1 Tax=Clostridium baratii TaxID=1561 RepID=UPI00097FAF08|nr:PTS sugar transporter subunit IIB [Clostridium baratii]AQM60100.1 PTS mannose/fructose/sorbose transporter subunit IIB [Clostridium baratii]MBS6042413.1 PTS sugar transporter subunit IIB [Clostridium baratii]
MKGIIHIRIDDRLIHGQVAARWSTGLGASRIMVANDQVAADEMQKGILRMVAPPGIATSIISKEKAATNILAGKYANQKVLLVLKSPKDALDLMDRGLEIKEINVGNMAKRDNTVQIKKSLSITKEEFENFKELMNRGVRLTARMVPDESEVLLENFLSKVSF